MWTLAKADLAVAPEELDTDPYLLNVENGTLGLRTGSLRPHSPEDMITKLAPVEFDLTAKSPTFDRFLKQILVDKELIRFVQRYLGYSLTGSTKERAMAVLHGVGKNGKSTLVELFQDLLGEYAATTSPDTVMQQKYSASREYSLAELAGVRFLAIAETKRGSELDEAVVKQVTGGDTISARPIYGKPFAYRPQFTIWMSTNHKPEIPDGSEAIWDRIKLIPFTERFDGDKADTELPERLRDELPGVLTWAVRGCVEWFANGLGTARAVEAATAEYREDTDVIERFFRDECEFGPKLKVSRSELYEAWESWCFDEGEQDIGKTSFSRAMKERGVVKNFVEGKSNGSRVWKGIGLKSDPDTPPKRESDPVQKSCKHGGVVDRQGHFTPESPKVSLDTPRVEKVLEKSPESDPSDPVVPDDPFEHMTFEGLGE